MITKTYTCDRCKATDTTNAISLIAVQVITSSVFSIPKKAEWCKKCTNAMGLCDTMTATEAKRIEPPPTLEDIIREIVRKELPQ